MAKRSLIAAAAGAAGILGLAVPAAAQDGYPASANLINLNGEQVGTVAVVETPNGVLVQLDATVLPPGGHGFHIHEYGRCDPPDFKSAGGHYNPENREHGVLDERGAHVGDMPNIFVGDGGAVRADFFVDNASLYEGEHALLDGDGSAFVIHETIDDYSTDPAGDAGNRIVCGVLSPGGPARAE